MNERSRTTILAVLGGLIAGLVLVLLVVLLTSDDGTGVAVSTTLPQPTTTVAPTTSTTTPATSSTAPPTTQAPSTTTTTGAPLGWGTETQQNLTPSGSPGPYLTDVRVGDHTTFTRVVFDFTGDGVPIWTVGYESGPGFSGSGGGDPVTVDGAAFLVVHVSPGLTHDIDTFAPVYVGPTSFAPGLGPITEIAFVDDFEADMMWVIGLDGVHGFTVDTLSGPVRLVVDIES